MGRIKHAMKIVRSTVGHVNPRYDISGDNMKEIIDSSGGAYELVCNGFRLGYVQGMKAAKSELKGKTTTV